MKDRYLRAKTQNTWQSMQRRRAKDDARGGETAEKLKLEPFLRFVYLTFVQTREGTTPRYARQEKAKSTVDQDRLRLGMVNELQPVWPGSWHFLRSPTFFSEDQRSLPNTTVEPWGTHRAPSGSEWRSPL